MARGRASEGQPMTKRILFVCTGNICRSPMALVLFRDMVCKDRSLRSAGIEADSAGTNPVYFAATQEAIRVMHEYGLDLTGHASKPLDSRLVDWADLILVKELWHKRMVLSRFPETVKKTHLLSEYVGEKGDVSDPYGSGIEAYRECAAKLQELLTKMAEKLKLVP